MSGIDVAFWADIIALQHGVVDRGGYLVTGAERLVRQRPGDVRLAEHLDECRRQLAANRATLERHIVQAYEAGWRPAALPEVPGTGVPDGGAMAP